MCQHSCCRVGNSLFCFFALCSFAKIAHFKEWLWAICSYRFVKRVTMSKSLSWLLTIEWPWAIRSRRSSKKSDVSDLLMIQANRSQKLAICFKLFIFFVCFWQFSPNFPTNGTSLYSFFSESLVFCQQKNKRVIPWEKMNNLLFFKEWLWAIRSRCSWQNIDRTDLLFFRINLLPLLLTKESGRNLLFCHKQIAPLLTKN